MGYEREGPYMSLDIRNVIAAWAVYLVLLLSAAIFSDVYISTPDQVGYGVTSEGDGGCASDSKYP